jgi:hypothetical protein
MGVYRDPVLPPTLPPSQNECPQMGVPDAPGGGSADLPGIGIAVPMDPGSLRTLR